MLRTVPLMARLAAVFALALLIASVPARAADRANLEAFLEVTGFDVALESIGLSAAHAPRMLGAEPGDFGHDWQRITRQVFSTEKMHDMALGILEATLSDDLLGHAATFYASPLGQKLVELENASHLVEDDDAKQADGEALLAASRASGDGRVAMLARLNAAVDGADQSLRAAQEITVRFLMAASHAGILDRRLDEAELRAILQAQEGEMRAEIQSGGLANAAYTYQDLSMDELRAYAEALEHPKMQQVYELMSAIQYEIMANRFELLAARMAELHPGQEL